LFLIINFVTCKVLLFILQPMIKHIIAFFSLSALFLAGCGNICHDQLIGQWSGYNEEDEYMELWINSNAAGIGYEAGTFVLRTYATRGDSILFFSPEDNDQRNMVDGFLIKSLENNTMLLKSGAEAMQLVKFNDESPKILFTVDFQERAIEELIYRASENNRSKPTAINRVPWQKKNNSFAR